MNTVYSRPQSISTDCREGPDLQRSIIRRLRLERNIGVLFPSPTFHTSVPPSPTRKHHLSTNTHPKRIPLYPDPLGSTKLAIKDKLVRNDRDLIPIRTPLEGKRMDV
jgi:hypothetical protein